MIFLLPSQLSNPSFGLDTSSATKSTETKCCRTKAKQDKCYGYLHKSKFNERGHLKEREILRMVLSSVLAGVIRTTMHVLVLSGGAVRCCGMVSAQPAHEISRFYRQLFAASYQLALTSPITGSCRSTKHPNFGSGCTVA